tara:strand:+ start:52846 stop:53385 length:540 start_codon:yes stop_codon:yes gene_type:complete
MKSFLLSCFIGIGLLTVGCNLLKIDDPKPKLPPITMTGANTFGAIVNGKVWVPISKLNQGAIHQTSDLLQIFAELESVKNEIDQNINIVISGEPVIPAIYHFDSKSNNTNRIVEWQDDITDCNYSFRSSSSTYYWGKVEILKLDNANRIVSGTFEFTISVEGCPDIRVEQGRFDLKLIN